MDSNLLNKKWVLIALLNFLLAGCMGLLLRYAHLEELSWMDFRNMMHGHSHVAMLGWAHLAIYSLCWAVFLDKKTKSKPAFSYLFWVLQASVIGMLVSFPIQGYGLWSISFSVLHVLASCVFVFLLWKNINTHSTSAKLFMLTAIVWYLVSTIGLWVMGPIMSAPQKDMALYYMAIQFFLHFQFNGWFTFSVMALFFERLDEKKVSIKKSSFFTFYLLLVVSCIFTYTLSVAWSNPHPALYFFNGLGVFLQLIALLFFCAIIKKGIHHFLPKDTPLFLKSLYLVALVSFVLKILMQAALIIPDVAVISYTIRQFVVGFIHLTMLGSISAFLIAKIILHISLFQKSNIYLKYGCIIFISGFLFSESFLFIQGLWLWLQQGFFSFYYEGIFIASILIPLGILFITLGIISGNKDNQKQSLIYTF